MVRTQTVPAWAVHVVTLAGCLVHACTVRRPIAKGSWWIGALRLIRCTIGPQINHEAQINHVKFAGIVLMSES